MKGIQSQLALDKSAIELLANLDLVAPLPPVTFHKGKLYASWTEFRFSISDEVLWVLRYAGSHHRKSGLPTATDEAAGSAPS